MSSVSLKMVDVAHDEAKHLPLSQPSVAEEILRMEGSHHKSAIERRVVLKQDLVIIPLFALGYFTGYLDRGQIGNARILGMQKDLHLTNQQFYNVLMIFFVGFLVAELPMALLMRIVNPQRVFGAAVLLFGVCATCIVASQYAGVMVLRTFLGVGEAVLTLSFIYLSLWYRPDELALRSGLIYMSTPFAGFTSGLVAYGVGKHLPGVDGYQSWQWLFMVEGFPTIALGIVIFFCLPSFPDTVVKKGSFLFRTEQERQIILARTLAGQNTVNNQIRPKQILAGLKDPKSYLGALAVAAPALGVTAFSIFLPTFIHALGYSPYRMHKKAIPLIICYVLSMIGFFILLSTTNSTALIAGCCFVASGAYPAIGIGASWITSIHGGYTKRCTAFGIAQIFIQGYSIIGTQVYTQPPRFFEGHGVLLGLYVVGLIALLILYFWLQKQNRAKDAAAASQAITGEVELTSASNMGFEELYDYHPDFRYPC